MEYAKNPVKPGIISLVIGVLFFRVTTSWADPYPITFAPQTNFVVGVCSSIDTAATPTSLSLMTNAGINGARFDMPWKTVETTAGSYTIPPAWDTAINTLTAKGIQPLVILDYGNPIYGIQRPTTPAQIALFSKYAQAVVHHFRERVKYFEIWNEFDQTTGTNLTTWGTPQQYINLVSAVYPAVKAIAPLSTFIVGTAGSPGIDHGFLQGILSLGVEKYGDAIGLHPYVHRRAAYQGEDAIALARYAVQMINSANGGHSYPVFITELGWPTEINDNGSALGAEFSESDQANYVTRSLLLMRTIGVMGVWFYALQDSGNAQGSDPFYQEHNFGLVRLNGTPKLAYQALADISPKVSSANDVTVSTVNNTAGVYDVTFEMPTNDPVQAIWSNVLNGAGLHYSATATCSNGSATLNITKLGVGSPWVTPCPGLTVYFGKSPFSSREAFLV